MPRRKQRDVPKNNSSYVRTYKGRQYKLTVRIEHDVPVYYLGRASFKSPSAAAKSITKREVNGWDFWHID